jgi:hypothetical protein
MITPPPPPPPARRVATADSNGAATAYSTLVASSRPVTTDGVAHPDRKIQETRWCGARLWEAPAP